MVRTNYLYEFIIKIDFTSYNSSIARKSFFQNRKKEERWGEDDDWSALTNVVEEEDLLSEHISELSIIGIRLKIIINPAIEQGKVYGNVFSLQQIFSLLFPEKAIFNRHINFYKF